MYACHLAYVGLPAKTLSYDWNSSGTKLTRNSDIDWRRNVGILQQVNLVAIVLAIPVAVTWEEKKILQKCLNVRVTGRPISH